MNEGLIKVSSQGHFKLKLIYSDESFQKSIADKWASKILNQKNYSEERPRALINEINWGIVSSLVIEKKIMQCQSLHFARTLNQKK